MTNLPVRYAPTQGGEQQGPYRKICCAVRVDYNWTIPVHPGTQRYHCPACYGETVIEINEDFNISIRGYPTAGTYKVDRLRMMLMEQSQSPSFPPLNQGGNIDDVIKSLE